MAAVLGRVRRFGKQFVDTRIQNFKELMRDYKNVVLDVGQSCKEQPVRAVVKTVVFGGLGWLAHTNATEHDYISQIIECKHQLMVLPEDGRNQTSEEYIDRVFKAFSDHRLSYWDFVVCLIVLESTFPKETKSFRSQYYSWPSALASLPNNVVEVSIMGKFFTLEQRMQDFDVPSDI
eukprot:m.36809 g.36809  ORF g.36809 m.36809 type:complete len:177 (-) comp9188_c0_seq1:6765-7295(-)